MTKIYINSVNNLYHPNKRIIELWINYVLKFLKKTHAIINIEIVNSDKMLFYNSNYCSKKKRTNTLSFPFEIPPEIPHDLDHVKNFLGDIIVCSELIEKEAKEQDKILNHHWCHILIHSVLHLVGYDHVYEKDAIEMESIEISLLEKLGIANPYVQ